MHDQRLRSSVPQSYLSGRDSGGSGGGGKAGGGVGVAAFIGGVFKAIGQAAKSEIEGKQVLENAVTAAREHLAANPNQVLTLLSDAEAEAAQSESYLWRIFFGRAVERAAAAEPRVQEISTTLASATVPLTSY
jgi:hypothetical protein